MKQHLLIETLKDKPGYLKSGPTRVSQVFNVSIDNALNAIREAKRQLKLDNSNSSDTE